MIDKNMQRPVYQHGDFHPDNLIYMPDGNTGVIDFNRWEMAYRDYDGFRKVIPGWHEKTCLYECVSGGI